MSEKTIAEKLTDIANNIPIIRQKAYAEGYNNGISSADAYETGYEQGVEAGKQAFLDEYLDYGNRTELSTAFAGKGWTEKNFKPNYDLKPTNAYMMFRNSNISIDLVEYLKSRNVTLDFSKAENTQYMFNNSRFTRVGIIDVRGSTNSCPLDGAFQNCRYLISIDKVYLKTGSNGEFNNATFIGCNELVEIRFEGEITKSVDMSPCTKLSHESLINILNALYDYVNGELDGSGKNKTLTLGTTNLAKLTAAEKAIATQKGWTLA